MKGTIKSMAENNSNLNKWAKWENPEDKGSAADTEESVDNVSETVETDNTVESENLEKEYDNNSAAYNTTNRTDSGRTNTSSNKKKLVGIKNPKIETVRILLYLAVTFCFAWIMEIFELIPMINSGNEEMSQQAYSMISIMLFSPALGVIVARISSREGLARSGIKFNFSQHKLSYLFSWFGVTGLVSIGAVLYFVIFRNNFDPKMSYYIQQSQAAGVTGDTAEIIKNFRIALIINILTAPIIDLVNCACEEWGWRAYLLPKLYRKFGTVPAILLTGLANGIWYAPLAIIGYFYGTGYSGFPVTGIIAMCIFSMVTGCIYSALTLHTGSIIPAIFAHSALNVMLPKAAYFTVDGGNYFVGPAATGIVSGIPLIIAAVVSIVYMVKHPVNSENTYR